MSTTVGRVRRSKPKRPHDDGLNAVVASAGPTQRTNIYQAWAKKKGAWPAALSGADRELPPWLWGCGLTQPEIEWIESVACDAFCSDSLDERMSLAPTPASRQLMPLVAAYHLHRDARRIDADTWWKTVISIVESSTLQPPLDPVQDIIAQSEIPWILSLLCQPAPRLAKRLSKSAARHLSQVADTELDGNGLPPATLWNRLYQWLGSWTRCQILADAAGRRCHDVEAQVQYEWMVREALRMTRGDRSPKWSDAGVENRPVWTPDFLANVLSWGGDRADETIAVKKLRLAPRSTARHNVDSIRSKKLPSPSVFSEWAQGAILRNSWKRNHFGLTLAYDGSDMSLEVEVRRELLFAGAIRTRVSIAGEQLPLEDEWHNTCAFSEEGVEYLEFETECSDGWRVQRQILFAGDPHVLIWADAVIGDTPESLELHVTMPLASGTTFKPLEETRDGWLESAGGRIAWLAPLAAAEWRTEASPMDVAATSEGLQLTAATKGRAAYLPWFLDLHPRRLKAPARTWRRLTVGQDRNIVPLDQAAGYRVQVARKQWLVYRSLTGAAQRTVLGQHLSTEFFAGRFHRDGEVTTYVEVEAP